MTVVLEFLYKLQINTRGYLMSVVRGEKIMLTDKEITTCFDLSYHVNRILPDFHCAGEEKEILKELL